MDFDDVIQRIIEMKSRFDIGFSSIDRKFIDELYATLFGKSIPNRGCRDCYRDAYTQIFIKLKRDKKMPEKSLFKLKPGAIVTFFGEAKAYVNSSLTDEIALRYLSKNPKNADLFSELPDNWKAMVEEYKINCTNDNGSENADKKEGSQSNVIEELNLQLEKVTTEKNLAETEVTNLKAELAGANESLKIALEENEKLRSENESLKATKKSSKTSKKTTELEPQAPENEEKDEAQEPSLDLD